MASTLKRVLRRLPSTRDLRAEMLALAGSLAGNRSRGRLTVVDPVISATTVRDEWQRLLPVLAPDVRERMALAIETSEPAAAARPADLRTESPRVPLDKPNYRYEVLRLLLGADLVDGGTQSVKHLIGHIGASQTPIRAALAELIRAGAVRSRGRGVEVIADEVSAELLAKLRALPQTIKFRFARGAQIRPPAALLKRAMPLLGPGAPPAWASLSLSGTPVAQADVPALNLAGTPRLDLLASLPREQTVFETPCLRLLDDGLELEPSVLEPAPVVVTVVRADARFDRDTGIGARCAHAMDVLLSLFDIGLREQALQYLRAMRA